VVFGVELAGFVRMMNRVGGVAGGDVGMMARGLDIAGFMVRSGFAVVFGRLLVVVGGVFVVFLRGMG
jgi:hypothetical protein